jgi:hypothetical protein
VELLRPRQRRRIKCFPSGEAGRLGFSALPPLSRPIDVSKIVGSVDRCNSITATFLPKKDRERSQRFRSVLRAMQNDIPLPPIEVYQLQREYYVIDGHHRVAAAIKLKLAYLDAIVTPVVLPGTTHENRLDNSRTLFARRTGLQHVDLRTPEGYDRAIAIIEAYASSPLARDQSYSFEEAARRWYDRVYKPLTRRIASSGILDHFPDESPGDILLQLYEYAARETAARGEDVDLEDALDDFETRYPPTPLSARALRPVSHTITRALPRRRNGH